MSNISKSYIVKFDNTKQNSVARLKEADQYHVHYGRWLKNGLMNTAILNDYLEMLNEWDEWFSQTCFFIFFVVTNTQMKQSTFSMLLYAILLFILGKGYW